MHSITLFVVILLHLLSSYFSVIASQWSCPKLKVCYALDLSMQVENDLSIDHATILYLFSKRFHQHNPLSEFSGVAFDSRYYRINSNFSSLESLLEWRWVQDSKPEVNEITLSESGLIGCEDTFSDTVGHRLIILLSRNEDTTTPSEEVIKTLAATDVSVFPIALGSDAYVDDLRRIASTPNLLMEADPSSLPSQIPMVVQKVCDYFGMISSFSPSPTANRSHSPSVSATVTPTPSNSVTPSPTKTPKPTMTPSSTPTVPKSPPPSPLPLDEDSPTEPLTGWVCANVDCGQCGDTLNCVANSKNSTIDDIVCAVVRSTSLFCAQWLRTTCGQKCPSKGARCFPRTSWPGCPSINIGTQCPQFEGTPTENTKNVTTLSNLVSYQVCQLQTKTGNKTTVSCLGRNCDATSGGSCTCST